MIPVIVTIIMFAVVLVGLLKNWNPTSWMLIVSLVFGLGWMLYTGASMTDPSSGNLFVDLFELIEDSAVSQFASVILCIGVCMGYIAYLDQIKAPAVFTRLASDPLKNRI